MKKTKSLSLRIAAICMIALFLASLIHPIQAKADGGILEDSVWEHLFTAEVVAGGVIQSICATNEYIITLENVADDPNTADIVSAYYKNDYDVYGNPVERFSLANRVWAEEWEHCNGMCWNPVKNEIYVALYTNTIEENKGCLYVMDPVTLTKKGRIKVTDDFNVLAITYDDPNDRYFIQTNDEGEYSILVLDSDFNIVDNYGPEPADPGYNFQDFTLANGYLLQFPLTWDMGIGEYMMAYSVEDRAVSDIIQLFFDELPDEKHIEPESVAWLDSESFIIPVNATAYDESRRCLFYRARFPHLVPVAETENAASLEEQKETQTVSAVSSTSVESRVSDVNVTKGNQQLSRTDTTKNEKKKFPVWIIIVILIVVLTAVAFLLYVQHVRKERAKREARMRKKRRMMLARLEKEKADISIEGEEADQIYYDRKKDASHRGSG